MFALLCAPHRPALLTGVLLAALATASAAGTQAPRQATSRARRAVSPALPLRRFQCAIRDRAHNRDAAREGLVKAGAWVPAAEAVARAASRTPVSNAGRCGRRAERTWSIGVITVPLRDGNFGTRIRARAMAAVVARGGRHPGSTCCRPRPTASRMRRRALAQRSTGWEVDQGMETLRRTSRTRFAHSGKRRLHGSCRSYARARHCREYERVQRDRRGDLPALPFPRPERLVAINVQMTRGRCVGCQPRRLVRPVRNVGSRGTGGGHAGRLDGRNATLTGTVDPGDVGIRMVTPTLFPMLGIRMALGARFLSPIMLRPLQGRARHDVVLAEPFQRRPGRARSNTQARSGTLHDRWRPATRSRAARRPLAPIWDADGGRRAPV